MPSGIYRLYPISSPFRSISFAKLILELIQSRYWRVACAILLAFCSIYSLSIAEEAQTLLWDKYIVYENQQTSAKQGESTVLALNALPHGPRELAKALYNQVMPVPVWRRLISNGYRNEAYNLSNFPEIFATYFRYLLLFYLIIFVRKKGYNWLGRQRTQYLTLLLIALLWMCSNSSSLGHRRIMGFIYSLR